MADIKIQDLPDLGSNEFDNSDFIIIQKPNGGTYKAPISSIIGGASEGTQYNATNQTLPINRDDLFNIHSTALIHVKIQLVKASHAGFAPTDHDFFIYKPKNLGYLLVGGGPGLQDLSYGSNNKSKKHRLENYDSFTVQPVGSTFKIDAIVIRQSVSGRAPSTAIRDEQAQIQTTSSSLNVTFPDFEYKPNRGSNTYPIRSIDVTANVHANIIS